MRVALLGPVSAEFGGTELGLGGLKQRAVFALLALNAGRVVSLDRLVDELWPEEPPSRATLGLQSYVSRLRRVLASAVPADPGVPQLVTRPPGWLLDLDPALVDVTRFEDLLGRARQASGGDAARLLREALGVVAWLAAGRPAGAVRPDRGGTAERAAPGGAGVAAGGRARVRGGG
jgi:DNA-binding SARP family transcriptional activator